MVFSRTRALIMVVGVAASQLAMAQDQGKALEEIAAFAERVCQTAPIKSSSNELHLNGNANAELKGLVSKVVDLGIGGAAQYKKAESEGVLQKDLAALLSKSVDCKERVSTRLIDKLISPSPAATPANPSPQPRPKTGAVLPEPSLESEPIKWIEYGQFFVVTGGGPDAIVNSVLLQGTSTTSVSIKDAYAVSGLTGHKQDLMMNVAYDGYHPVDKVDIPPQARVWLELIFRPALHVDDFLKEWGRLSITIVYNGVTYHRDFDDNFIRQKLQAMNAGEFGPHVTVKQ